MKTLILGFLIGILILPATIWCYFRLGYAPAATAAPPLMFEKRLARMALNARIEKEAPKTSPVAASEENYAAGATVYRDHCAVCHGLPGQPATATSKGMFPKPPQLFKHGVTDDPVGETYWKVENGIRLTGMPAYVKSLSEKEIWQVSLMLANADKLSDPVKQSLSRPFEIH